MKTCCLGDVLLATPLARALAGGAVGGVVDWAVDGHSVAALANNPSVGARLDATGCVRGAWRPARLARLLLAMRAGRYDTAFVPERSPVLAVLPRLAGIPVRVGLDSGGRGRSHTVRVPVRPGRHEAELYLDLARAVGIPVGPPGQHVILKIVKQQNADGSIRVVRSNVYNKVVPFVAFTKMVGEGVKGTHDGPRR